MEVVPPPGDKAGSNKAPTSCWCTFPNLNHKKKDELEFFFAIYVGLEIPNQDFKRNQDEFLELQVST